MKINKSIPKRVKDATELYQDTLKKAIVELLKLTGCRSEETFGFEKPIIFHTAYKDSKKGLTLNSKMVVINGVDFFENKDGWIRIDALYDGETVNTSLFFQTEDYEAIYNRVLESVQSY